MKWLLALAAACSLALAQQPAVDPAQAEKDELRRQLAEANTSQIEVLRLIESYLAGHPDTQFRGELEHRAALAAIALHDDQATVRFGEASLGRTPDDTQLIPAVTRALLALDTRDAAERALKYTRRTEDLVRQMQKDGNPGNVNPVEWRNQTDLLLNRALVDDARATGKLGRAEEALATAQRAFDLYPDANSAREIANAYERLGKLAEAVRALADAFSIPDSHATDADRAKDRARLGELYRKWKGSDEGLGALCLEAYDRDAALLKLRESRVHEGEPNGGRKSALEFTLSALEGPSLEMASLKGKVVVMDMWATWCVPCREQHPLYEQVKERFRDNPAVVFLSINADAERSSVKPFIAEQKWQGPVYFQDGLASLFAVEGLPATILLGRDGKLFTYLNGYVDKARFVELLTERIRQAVAAGPAR